MSDVTITCPNCAKELKVRDYLLGKKVVCPRCSDGFRVSSQPGSDDGVPQRAQAKGAADSSASDATGIAEPVAPPIQRAPDQAPPIQPAPVQTPVPVTPDKAWSIKDTPPRAIPVQVAPVQVAPVQVAPVQVAPVQVAPVEGTPGQDAPVGVTPVKVTPVSVTPPPDAQRPQPIARAPRKSTPPPTRPKRVGKAAKFIATELTETRVQLGADGQLPNLVLRDEKKTEVEDAPAQTSNPLLLIGVLCFSVTISVVMLFVDTEKRHVEGKSKEQAREQIQRYYAGTPPTIKLYQRKLREALQAHNLARLS